MKYVQKILTAFIAIQKSSNGVDTYLKKVVLELNIGAVHK